MLKIYWFRFWYWLGRVTYPIRALRITSRDTLLRGKECEEVCERLKRLNNGSLRDYEFILSHVRDFLWGRDDKPVPEYNWPPRAVPVDIVRMRINAAFREQFAEHQDAVFELQKQNQNLAYENQTLRNAILIISPQAPDKDHHQ